MIFVLYGTGKTGSDGALLTRLADTYEHRPEPQARSGQVISTTTRCMGIAVAELVATQGPPPGGAQH